MSENKVTVSLGDFSKTYVVFRTSAPRNYDYDYCIPIYGDDIPAKEDSRIVLIPEESVAYQTGRYGSGLFWSKPEDCGNEYIKETLYKRIHTKT